MKKIAIVGSRRMSQYGKEVINKLLMTNDQLNNKNVEIVTIKVSGCNSEVMRICQKRKININVFEGKNFQKLNEDMANYADVLVIIEGGKNSGTLLLAAKFVEMNKEVYCIPGRITEDGSETPNWLIKEGAIPLVNLEDLTLLR